MRDHPRLFAGIGIGAILSLVVVLTLGGGCMTTPDPLNPTRKVNPQQLTLETADQQQKFDQQAATINAERANVLTDYQQQASDLVTKYQKQASKLANDTTQYNTAVATFNAKLQAAAADLQTQANRNEKLMELAGGVIQAAGTGTFGPLAALGTSLFGAASLGLVGAWRDSANKSASLQVKNQQIAQLAAASSPTPAVMAAATGVNLTTQAPAEPPATTGTADGTGAAALVQAVAPAPAKLAA